MHLLRCVVALPILFVLHCPSSALAEPPDPATLTFPELVTLATVDPVPSDLQLKLNSLLSTPFISQRVRGNLTQPSALKVVEWNINRGENEAEVLLALTDAQAYLSRARQNSRLAETSWMN